MKHKITHALTAAALMLLSVTPVHAESTDFDAAEMLSDLEQKLKLSREQYEKSKPELERALQEKSRELQSSINKQVDEGIVELESMGKEMSAASEQFKRDLEKTLNSEQVQELKAYLKSLDKEAIEEAYRELLAKLSESLQLTAQQLEQLKPVLRDYLEQASALLQQFAKDSSRTFEQFRKQYEALGDELRKHMQDALTSDQMIKLDRQLEDVRDRVQKTVFTTT
ncbi:MAG TPA: hypothetical protein DDW55_09155 [Gammaproteobacteria bacterium]|nr:hypothetical protein [Gammaproteobacteria bacterium]